MPKQYEEIRDSYLKRGEDLKTAKRIAAQTFIKRGKGGSRSSRAKSLHDAPAKGALTRKYRRRPRGVM